MISPLGAPLTHRPLGAPLTHREICVSARAVQIAAVLLAVALAAGCVWVRFASTPASAHASAQAAAHATAAAAAPAEQVPTLGLTGQAPGPHREITAAEWRGIASNPDAHVGERIIVYGEIVEVDSGVADHFRA